jgi:hypothetical protein
MEKGRYGNSEGLLFLQVAAPGLRLFLVVMYIESDYFADEYDVDTEAALSALHAVLVDKAAAGYTPLVLTDANRSLNTRPTDQSRRRDQNAAFSEWLHDAELESAQRVVADGAGRSAASHGAYSHAPC